MAYECVRPCIVQIHSNGSYGAGTIWSMDEEYITIITNKHVLENWSTGDNHYVIFYDGAVTDAELFGTSEDTDVGIIRVSVDEIPYFELIHYRSVNYDMDIFNCLTVEDEIITIGSANAVKKNTGDEKILLYGENSRIANEVYSGVIVSTDIYVTKLDKNMIYCYCYARGGMSGGGVFDSYGHYIGMLTGGTQDNEAVAIRLPDVIDAVNEIIS